MLHRLRCGDATNPNHMRNLMGKRSRGDGVDNIHPTTYASNACKAAARSSTANFCRALGEDLPKNTSSPGRQLSDSGLDTRSTGLKILFVCIDLRHTSELRAAGEQNSFELKNICVWVKSNAGMGTFYRSQHEFVCVFKSGTARHFNAFELGQHGRNRSNVWSYSGNSSFRAGRMDDLAVHPTVKPLALVADAIRDCSRRGDIVLDPFIGSGTTVLAAEKVGRCGYGLEIDPLYVDVAVRRWQNYTKRDAILAATGQTFDEVAERALLRETAEAIMSARTKKPLPRVRSKTAVNGGEVGYGKPPRTAPVCARTERQSERSAQGLEERVHDLARYPSAQNQRPWARRPGAQDFGYGGHSPESG